MKRLLTATALAAGLLLATPVLLAQGVSTRAYAPDNLRGLSVQDQTRVISLEYSEQARGRSIPQDQLRFYLDQVNRSNWTFSQIKRDIGTSLSGGGNGGGGHHGGNNGGNNGNWPQPPPPRPPSGDNRTVRCESQDNKRRNCTTPWQGASRVVRQLSATQCSQNYSWGMQRDSGIWVQHGCRAEFGPAYAISPGRPQPGHGNNANYSVTCSSTGNQRTSCAWTARNARPRLIEQLSRSACTENRSWGYDGNSIWVSNGCRARFGVR